MMRRSLLLTTAALFISLNANAQKNALAGTWDVFVDAFYYSEPIQQVQVNSNGTVGLSSVDGQSPEAFLGYSGCNFTEKSIVNYSQFSHLWAYECSSTDTVGLRTLTATSAGNQFFLYGHIQIINGLKQNSAMSETCFTEGCIYLNGDVYLRPVAKRVVQNDQLYIGSSTTEWLTVEEVRFTDQAIEVLLRFPEQTSDYSGTLHAPGADYAFFLRDSQGNRYDIIGQYGWGGNEANGFGPYTIPANTEKFVILYFERAPDINSSTNFSMIEGECESGCWNVYDIRLRD